MVNRPDSRGIEWEHLAIAQSLRVLVLSDTHGSLGLLKTAVTDLAPLDLILHLGDHSAPYPGLTDLTTVPVLAVAGNCDGEHGRDLPESMRLKLAGRSVFMTHGHRFSVKQTLDRLAIAAAQPPVAADLILFGHTHQYLDQVRMTVSGHPFRMLNPGSASQSFFQRNPSLALVLFAPASIQVFRYPSGVFKA